MDRCRLGGSEGDTFNAIASAAGMSFGKLLAHAADLLRLEPTLWRLAHALARLIAALQSRRPPTSPPSVSMSRLAERLFQDRLFRG